MKKIHRMLSLVLTVALLLSMAGTPTVFAEDVDWNITSHCVCGARDEEKHIGDCNGEILTWREWTATDSMPTESGNWYLSDNVTFMGMNGWIIGSADVDSSSLKVDLNGYTVTYGGSIRAVEINLEAAAETNVVITDSSKNHTGKIINKYPDACTCDGGLLDMYGQGTANSENASLSVYRATLDGSSITSSKKDGGTVRVEMGHTLNLYGVKLLGAAGAANGSAIYNYGGNVNIADASEITASTVTGSGGAIYNVNGADGSVAALTVADATVTGAAGSNGGAIYNADGSVIIDRSVIHGAKVSSSGGAIYNEGTLTITDSTVKALQTVSGTNVASNGGAIFSTGTVSITGGKIIAGHVSTSGGAIAAHGGSFTVTDVEIDAAGKIAGNRAPAVAVGNKAAVTFTMNGNTVITGGSTAGPGGGAVTVQDTGSTANAQFIMNGGVITGGISTSITSGYGGGNVRVTSGGKFYMNGGIITGGTGTNYQAGGVMLTGTGTMTISGSAKITGNNGADLYLNKRTLTVAADWEGNGSDPMVVGMANATGLFAVAGTGATLNANYFTGTLGYASSAESDGLHLVETAEEIGTIEHCLCGANSGEKHIGDCDGSVLTWTPWDSANSLPMDPGNYYLVNNVQLAERHNLNDNAAKFKEDVVLNIDLNGKIVYGPANSKNGDRAFVLLSSMGKNIELTITDASKGHTGMITNPAGRKDTSKHGTLFFLYDNGGKNVATANIYRVTLDASGTTGTNGVAIQVENMHIANLYGATVKGGTASSKGGAINIGGTGTVKAEGCTIGAVKAANGGAISMSGGSLTLTDCTVNGAKATYGGALYMTGGKAILTDCTICGAEATQGGAIYLGGKNASVTMNGGLVTGADVTAGGAVNIADAGGSFTMKASAKGEPVIDGTGCTAVNYGAAVHVSAHSSAYSSFTMECGQIKGGIVTGDFGGGSVFVQGAKASFTMNGGTISGGKLDNTVATKGGGNIRLGGSGVTFTMNGGTITGGESTNSKGGGLYVSAGNTFVIGGDAKITGNARNDLHLEAGACITIKDGWSGNGTTPMVVDMADSNTAFAALEDPNEDHSGSFTVGRGGGAELRDGKLYGTGFYVNEGGKPVLVSNITGALTDVMPNSYIQLLSDITEDVTVSESVILDLNGHTITGNMTIASGAVLKLFDSATADYTAEGRGKIIGTVQGALARTMNTPSATYGYNYKYLTIKESDGSYSAHRIYLSVKSTVLVPYMQRAEYTGTAMNYKTVFKCNDVVTQYVTAYGAQFVGDNTVFTNYLENKTLLTGVENDNAFVSGLHGTMKSTNTPEQNKTNADRQPEVCAYIRLNDGLTEKVTSTAVSRSLKTAVAHANTVNGLTEAQRLALANMYDTFKDTMDTWTDIDLLHIKLLHKWLVLGEEPEKNPDGIKNVIIIIGDGMGPEQVKAGELATGEAYAFRSGEWKLAWSNTNCLDENGDPEELTDSAAGGTALATGVLTTTSHVGTDKNGMDLRTILDYASDDFGKATGVISNDNLYGATPADYSGHSTSRYNTEEILRSQFDSGINLLCGQNNSTALNIGKNYGTDYTICTTVDEINANMDAERVYWQLEWRRVLSDCVAPALEYLSQDEDGFVLMIEQAHIDKYGHNNGIEGLVDTSLDLNETVKTILEWIGDRDDTAIIITADHETGGLSVSADAASGYKSYTYDGSNTFYYKWSSTNHTKTPVGVWAYGFEPHFENYYIDEENNIIKNISVFDIMLDVLQNP